MAEFVVTLRKEIKDSLTRQGMHNTRGLHKKKLEERGKRNEYFFLREHTCSLDSKKEHAAHFEQQHRNTYHSGQLEMQMEDSPARVSFSCAHDVHANENCSHSS